VTETAQTPTRRNRVPAATQASTRRDRVRAATVQEIKETARRVLVAEGIEGLSLRAIAREMGMTAPALYRYFPSREELVVALIGDLYQELTDAMEAAAAAEPADDTGGQLAAVSREFRRWAVGHPREFGLLFGSPIPGVEVEKGTEDEPNPAGESSRRFGRVFGELVARIYLEKPFPIPAEDELDPELRKELGHWAEELPMELPVGLAQVFLSCWIRLYGTVAMEVFGHLAFAVADAGPVFEEELKDLSDLLGMEYRPPVSPAGRQSATAEGR
jgi:AcrR family transcriptional regulator